jgi:hypothetical protein
MEHIICRREILRSNCHKTRIRDFEFGILESVTAAVGPVRAQAAQETEPSNHHRRRGTEATGVSSYARLATRPDRLPRSPPNARIAVVSSGVASTGTPESEAWNGEAGLRPPAPGCRGSARTRRLRSIGQVPCRTIPAGSLDSLVNCDAMRRTRTEHFVGAVCRPLRSDRGGAYLPYHRGVRMLLLSRGSTSGAVTAPRFFTAFFLSPEPADSFFFLPSNLRASLDEDDDGKAGQVQCGSSTSASFKDRAGDSRTRSGKNFGGAAPPNKRRAGAAEAVALVRLPAPESDPGLVDCALRNCGGDSAGPVR